MPYDGSMVLVRQKDAFRRYEAKPRATDPKTISTAGLEVDRVPAEEWAEIFDEVWRGYRDFFYVRNLHGYDWPAIGDRYRALLPDVADPLDLSRSLDGLMVSGGADIDPSYYDEEPLQSTRCVPKERTDFEIALVRTIIELGKPVFGICYGMQLLNVAFGGALYQDLNTQFGVTVDHGRGEHMITGEGRHISGSFKVNSSHHQGVRELGKGLASSVIQRTA